MLLCLWTFLPESCRYIFNCESGYLTWKTKTPMITHCLKKYFTCFGLSCLWRRNKSECFWNLRWMNRGNRKMAVVFRFAQKIENLQQPECTAQAKRWEALCAGKNGETFNFVHLHELPSLYWYEDWKWLKMKSSLSCFLLCIDWAIP